MITVNLFGTFFFLLLNCLLFRIEAEAATLFQESFADSNFAARGWYDNTSTPTTTSQQIPGSTASAQYHWALGATVYVSYWVKYSANYVGSGVSYHPHEFMILTTIDPDYSSLAFTHTTAYIEQNVKTGGGVPRIALTDGANIIQNKININLVGVTENRAANGCNGNTDAHPGSCYNDGTEYNNSRVFDASQAYFTGTPGAFYKNDWHFVEAYYQLNSILNGVGQPDGLMQYWFDGTLVINVTNLAIRTGEYPTMQFDQFVMAPYIGVGSPADQSFWVDDLTVATSRPTPGSVAPSPPTDLMVN